jgi:hypothetical protein
MSSFQPPSRSPTASNIASKQKRDEESALADQGLRT